MAVRARARLGLAVSKASAFNDCAAAEMLVMLTMAVEFTWNTAEQKKGAGYSIRR